MTDFEIEKTIFFVSAVLGGFSIALAIGLLQIPGRTRMMQTITGLAILASLLLIFATITGTFGAIWIAERPALEGMELSETPEAVLISYRWCGSSFLFGLGCLLLTMGLSGFLRSRALGWLTLGTALITICTLLYYLAEIVDIIYYSKSTGV